MRISDRRRRFTDRHSMLLVLLFLRKLLVWLSNVALPSGVDLHDSFPRVFKRPLFVEEFSSAMDPYLDHSAASSEPLLEKSLSNWKEPSRFRKIWLVALAIHLSIILIYSSAFLWSWHYLKEQYVHGPRLTYSQYSTRQDKQSKLINAMQVPQEMP